MENNDSPVPESISSNSPAGKGRIVRGPLSSVTDGWLNHSQAGTELVTMVILPLSFFNMLDGVGHIFQAMLYDKLSKDSFICNSVKVFESDVC